MSIARPAPVRARKNTAQQKARLSQHPAPDPVFLLGQRFASLIENSPHELPMRPIDAAGLCGEIMLAMSYHQAQSQAGAVVQIRALIYFLNKICRDGTADLADLNVIRRLAHSSLCAVEGSCNLSRESLAGHFMVPLGSNPFMPSFGSIATEKLCEGTTAS